MNYLPMFYTLLVFFCIYHPSVRADPCASHPNVEVTACNSGGGSSDGTGTAGTGGATGTGGTANLPMEIDGCRDYSYNGPATKRYTYKGNTPFTIEVKTTNSITGNGITIGNFKCQVGATSEDCYKYTIKGPATPPLSFEKDNNGVICIHGQGSLTFMIDDGNCRPRTCVNSFNTFRGHKLKAFDILVPRDQAKAACEAEGAHLAVIKDANMAAAITEARTDVGMRLSTWMWFGLKFKSKDASGFTYDWDNQDLLNTDLNGVPLTAGVYTNWAASDSHDAENGETCYFLGIGEKWEDIVCSFPVAYICECA